MIEHVSQMIANRLGTTLHYEKDNIEILAYGLECIINSAITSILILAFALLTHHFVSCLIWIVYFTLLRSKIGGYHAPSHISCILSSTGLCIFSVIISDNYIFPILLILLVPGSLISSFCIIRYAPLASTENIPLDDRQATAVRTQAIVLILTGYLAALLLMFMNRFSLSFLFLIIITSVVLLFQLERKKRRSTITHS